MKILVIDDDPEIRNCLAVGFKFQWKDCTVIAAHDGESGLNCMHKLEPDLVLLDVGLPGKDGTDVLREIRRDSDVPVIMLTGRSAEIDQVRCLEFGADGYVVKPFNQLVLLAKVRAVLRRAEANPPLNILPDFVVGDLAINFQSHEVWLRGKRVRLTPVEYRLLHALASNAGRLLSHRKLLDLVWGPDHTATLDHLHVYINRLRAKVEVDPNNPHYIENERGHGYRFVRAASIEDRVPA